MPDQRYYITHYTKYFNLKSPSLTALVMALLAIGVIAGSAMSFIINYRLIATGYIDLLISGLSTGIIVISLPGLLTVLFIKAMRRRMKMRHAMLATIIITALYALFLILDAFLFSLTSSITVAYLMLLFANACVYGYWFLVDKLVIGRSNSAWAIAATQPVLNTLLYLPVSKYIHYLGVPLQQTLIKLSAGMLVFMVAGYTALYLVDRPAKRMLDISGIALISSMVGQWLYDLTKDVRVIGQGAGVRRDLSMDLLQLKGSGGQKAIFFNPDIHFGPFSGVGGSVAPERLGDLIAQKRNSTPFVIHSPLTLQDTPISTAQVRLIEERLDHTLSEGGEDFERAYGSITMGSRKTCRAINIALGDTSLVFLTRAPEVTEDIGRNVGMIFKNVASKSGKRNVLIVDSHNSRFESASMRELSEIHKDSPYVKDYKAAIMQSARGGKAQSVSFGAAYSKISKLLGKPRDIGEGYTSVCVFGFGKKRFALIYFDANNMLPSFRKRLLDHVKGKFGMDAETCTTDTHSINALNLAASNSLGRYTSLDKLIPILDPMIESALNRMEPVSYAYKRITMGDFAVWGKEADRLIESTSREVKRLIKYAVPLLVIATFIIAAWVIYIV